MYETESGAIFDEKRRYRYLLWRQWSVKPTVLFIMLNPSTADDKLNDPTIKRCINFARGWGFGRLEVANVFGFRATDSRLLRTAKDPVGPRNDEHLLASVERSQMVVVAWGNLAKIRQRNQEVLSLLEKSEIFSLGRTKLGHPRHPLYVRNATEPVLFIQ